MLSFLNPSEDMLFVFVLIYIEEKAHPFFWNILANPRLPSGMKVQAKELGFPMVELVSQSQDRDDNVGRCRKAAWYHPTSPKRIRAE